jgi:hypothetical protein
VNINTSKDVLGTIKTAINASLTTAMAGANNDMKFLAKPAGVVGNGYRVAVVVAGTNTVLSIGLSGNDLTINSATNGGGAATTTAAQAIAAIQAHAAAAKFEVSLAPGNDGSGVIAAFALTNLTGGVDAVGIHADVVPTTGPASPNVVDGSSVKRRSVPAGQKGVANRGTNRSIRKR